MFETAFERWVLTIFFGALCFFARDIYNRFLGAEKKQNTFMTMDECDRRRSNCPSAKATSDLNDFKAEMRNALGVIKGVLLAIAAKSNIPERT